MTPLAIFARPPVAGRVKTRLAPALGEERAAELYRAFVLDTVAAASAVDAIAPELWIAGDPRDAGVLQLAGSVPTERQPEGDLGARIAAALERGIAREGRALVVGTDAPTLPPAVLGRATHALELVDVVLGPTADGGYYLIGARGRVPALFAGVRWSTAHVLSDTLALAERAALRVTVLPPWYDVDRPRDLVLLRAHLALSPADAPRTATILQIL